MVAGLRFAAGRSLGLAKSLAGREDQGPGGRDVSYLFKALICCYKFPRRNEEQRLQTDFKPKAAGRDQPWAFHLEDACLEREIMIVFSTSGREKEGKKKRIKGCWTYRRYI